MIKGIGCDMIEIARIERLLARPGFLEKFCTGEERNRASSPQTAAGIWAAKEAVSKALGTGFSGFWLRDIEICRSGSGQPYARLYGGAEKRLEALDGKTVHLSISHDGGMAMAFAVIE